MTNSTDLEERVRQLELRVGELDGLLQETIASMWVASVALGRESTGVSRELLAVARAARERGDI